MRLLIPVALLLYAGYLAGLYPGVAIRVPREPPPAPGLERWQLATPEGDVEALFLPGRGANASGRRPAVVFGHGNGEVVDFWTTGLDGFRDRGIGVLLVEYPGYGRSAGRTSERAIRTAMSAAYDRLVSDPRVDPSRVVGFGQSLGGGAVCLLSRDRPLRALILQSTFTSFAAFTSRYLAPAFLLRDRFDNETAVRSFAGPVLVIHGRQDEVIPYRLGQRLAAASPRATLRLYDCGHGCWDPDHLPFWKDVDAFLAASGIR